LAQVTEAATEETLWFQRNGTANPHFAFAFETLFTSFLARTQITPDNAQNVLLSFMNEKIAVTPKNLRPH
jgi:hypothetical protein